MSNKPRPEAAKALRAFRKARGHTSCDCEDIADLIADLAHLADQSDDPDLEMIVGDGGDVDWGGDLVLERAERHYGAEKED